MLLLCSQDDNWNELRKDRKKTNNGSSVLILAYSIKDPVRVCLNHVAHIV